ncbi:hypothetical protein L6164_001225 [Bauhinia variegata]|uniref:Uncharacterized protein n=1 Tax=Bauhinia variegata TaxID=167791 RepID=A0ACB9QA96_BAUVA|nr:hypothetical protein L6164_001225 [Bauhinia variegata]
MIDYFLRTLTTPFIEMMTAGVYNDFSELVLVGERIEILYKEGKLGFLKGESLGNGKQKAFVQAKKKEREVSLITIPRPQGQHYQAYPRVSYSAQASLHYYQPRPNTIPVTPTYRNINPPLVPAYPANSTPFIPTYPMNLPPTSMLRPLYQDIRTQPRPFKNEPFPNILVTKTKLFKQLVEANLMVPKFMQPQQPSYPHWYNSNLTCDYHNGGAPNVNTNPLLNHTRVPKVNAMGEDFCRVRRLRDVRMSMKTIWEGLKEAGQEIQKPFRSINEEEEYHKEELCVHMNNGGTIWKDVRNLNA